MSELRPMGPELFFLLDKEEYNGNYFKGQP